MKAYIQDVESFIDIQAGIIGNMYYAYIWQEYRKNSDPANVAAKIEGWYND